MTTFAVFAAAGLITLGLRTGLVLLGAARPLPERFNAAASLMPAAVLAAIVASALFVSEHEVTIPHVAEVLAVALGTLAVRRFDNVGYALLVGLPTYWLASAIGLG